MRQLLIGHTSQETAFVQPDYPYGRELRCQRRVWIESKKGHGQRFVYQTSNPKIDPAVAGRVVWNKPHPAQYSTITVMYLDDSNGHVELDGVRIYGYADDLESFVARYGEADLCKDPWIAKVLPVLRKLACKREVRPVPAVTETRALNDDADAG